MHMVLWLYSLCTKSIYDVAEDHPWHQNESNIYNQGAFCTVNNKIFEYSISRLESRVLLEKLSNYGHYIKDNKLKAIAG